MRRREFSAATKLQALKRQRGRCGSCGTVIPALGEAARSQHKFGESAHAHHVRHARRGGSNTVENCVILCWSCHYSVHEGGRFRTGTVDGTREDFPHFHGDDDRPG